MNNLLGIHWLVWLIFIGGALWIFWPKGGSPVIRTDSETEEDEGPTVKKGSSLGAWAFALLGLGIAFYAIRMSLPLGEGMADKIRTAVGLTPSNIGVKAIPYGMVLVATSLIALLLWEFKWLIWGSNKPFKTTVLVNKLTGSLRPTNPGGIFVKLPWELPNGEPIDLGKRSVEIKDTFPVKGGIGALDFEGTVPVAVMWSQVYQSEKVDAKFVDARVKAAVSQLVASAIQKRNSLEEVLSQLQAIAKEVSDEWEGTAEIEEETFHNVGTLKIDTLAPTPDTLKRLGTILDGQTLALKAKALEGVNKEAVDAALIDAGKKDINVMEVRGAGDGDKLLAALSGLASIFHGGGGGKGKGDKGGH